MRTAKLGILWGLFLVLGFSSTPRATPAQLNIYTEQSFNAHFKDRDGRVKGYVYELVRAMQARMGDTTPIRILPWARAYKLAVSKPNTLLFSTTFTEARRPLFKWVGPVAESIWVLYARKGDGIVISSLDEAKAVGSIGTYIDDVREQLLTKRGFTNLEPVSDDTLNLRKLINNRITLWASGTARAANICGRTGISLSRIEPVFTLKAKGLFIAFNRATPDDIVDTWARAYQDVRSDGTMAAIYQKWSHPLPCFRIPPAPRPPHLPPETRQYN